MERAIDLNPRLFLSTAVHLRYFWPGLYKLGQQIGLGGCRNDMISLVYNFACTINFNEHAHAQTLDMTSFVTQFDGLIYKGPSFGWLVRDRLSMSAAEWSDFVSETSCLCSSCDCLLSDLLGHWLGWTWMGQAQEWANSITAEVCYSDTLGNGQKVSL